MPKSYDQLPDHDLSKKEIEDAVGETVADEISKSNELAKQMESMDIEGLLAEAEKLVLDINTDSNVFIIEARKRIDRMPDNKDKKILHERLDKIYGEYLDLAKLV